MKISSLTIDPVAVEQGEWIENLPDCDDLRILSKGMNCVAAKQLISEKMASLPRNVRAALPVSENERINLEVAVEVCILGWENLTDDDGAPILYSKEQATAYIKDRKYEPLQVAFLVAANRVGDARKKDAAKIAKN